MIDLWLRDWAYVTSMSYVYVHSLTSRHSRDTKGLPRNTIFKIIDCLGAEGMSGDETDTTGVNPKAVRRIEIPWISSCISQLFETVDSYESSL